jgi:chemotaxis protein CheZ
MVNPILTANLLRSVEEDKPRLKSQRLQVGTWLKGAMMQRRRFRVDQLRSAVGAALVPDGDADAIQRHHELILEIRAVRSVIEPREHDSQRIIDTYQAQIAEIQKLKNELDLIQAAINETKQEIATLHVTGFRGPEMRRVTDELDAIVGGTESATENILNAAEEIDQCANTLCAMVKTEQEQNLSRDIRERTVQIFESCNFQDLTGQRITKVVNTLKFIEDHIVKMMDIWGGIEALKDFAPAAMAERAGDAKLLNGPRLGDEAGHASQDDIDALFN